MTETASGVARRVADLGREAAELPREAAEEALRLGRTLSHRVAHLERRVERSIRREPEYWTAGTLALLTVGIIVVGLAWTRRPD